MEPQKNVLTVPIAIVVAGIIIGGAIFFSRGGPTKDLFPPLAEPAPDITEDFSPRPVDASEHILGNPNAEIVMIEYSDLECPFCKSFHATMHTLIDQYGKSGKAAWVYRHFPLDIHPKAPREAAATECAHELGGNSAFWKYIDKVFEVTPSNNGLEESELPKIAGQIGLAVKDFTSCLDGGIFTAKIKADYDDGLRAGVNGTPHTILIPQKSVTLAAEKRLAEINQIILRQMPPGSPNLIAVTPKKDMVAVSGALQVPLMKEILELLLSGK